MPSYAGLNCVHVFYMFLSTKEALFLSETLLRDLMDLPQSTDNLFLVRFSVEAYKSRAN